MTLHFNRSAAQQTALDQLLVAQQTPGSAQYHKWLTPAQFGAQFGLASSDIAQITSWLTSQGLTVTGTAHSSTFVTVSGTIAQVQKAFGTSIHTVLANGEQHIANTTDPVLPAAVANVVSAITGLSDFRLKARARIQKMPAESVKPAFTSSLTSDHYLVPGDFNTIYDLKPLLAQAINGSNMTIAVMGQTDISLADVAAFRAASGLAANVPSVITNGVDPGTVSGDLVEAQLDVEWAGAIAPSAKIIYVNTSTANDAGGVLTSLVYAVDNATAPILSISYGLCEPLSDEASLYSYNANLQQANAQGQTIIAPGGDSGATDCDTAPPAADGLAVDFPASSPNATGVGGLMFNEGTGTYWSASNAADQSSALSYIPEQVWNENSTTDLAAGGGGASMFFTKPAWQVGSGVPADYARDVPDIALNAAASHVGYLICYSGSCTNGFRDAAGDLAVVGGTSAGVPSFAGILALVEQKIGMTTGVGNANPVIYGLAATSAAAVFHDTTVGNNQSPCALGSPNCSTSSAIGYSAAGGYDLASGWGSVDGTNLANLWTSTTPTGTTTSTGLMVSITSVGLPSATVQCGLSGTVAISVSVASATNLTSVPTGTVQLLVDGAATGLATSLSGGAATISLNSANLSSGGHTIQVVYSGDTVYAPSKGNLSPTISPSQVTYVPSVIDVVSTTQPDFSLTPCLPTVTAATGTTAAGTTLTVTSLNGFSGAVTFTASSDSTLVAGEAFSVTPVTIASGASGTTVLTLSAFQTTSNSITGSGKTRKSGSGTSDLRRQRVYQSGAGTVVAALLLIVVPRRRRLTGLLVALLAIGSLGVVGCGSGNTVINGGTGTGTGTGTNTTDTTPSTYIVNVTATGTNSAGQALVHTASLTFTVTN